MSAPGVAPAGALVLPASARLRRSADFAATLRGSRAARGDGLLVVHLAVDPSADGSASSADTAEPRVGFVVPRSVGSAVSRNRVRRRLRHLVRERLDRLPPGTRVVVRVLPAAAAAPSTALGPALDDAIDTALNRALGTRTRPA